MSKYCQYSNFVRLGCNIFVKRLVNLYSSRRILRMIYVVLKQNVRFNDKMDMPLSTTFSIHWVIVLLILILRELYQTITLHFLCKWEMSTEITQFDKHNCNNCYYNNCSFKWTMLQDGLDNWWVIIFCFKSHISIQTRKTMWTDLLEVCEPIKSFEELWAFVEDPPEWSQYTVDIFPRSNVVVQNSKDDCHVTTNNFVPKTRLDRRSTPRTLVCHDMMSGYLEDKQVVLFCHIFALYCTILDT